MLDLFRLQEHYIFPHCRLWLLYHFRTDRINDHLAYKNSLIRRQTVKYCRSSSHKRFLNSIDLFSRQFIISFTNKNRFKSWLHYTVETHFSFQGLNRSNRILQLFMEWFLRQIVVKIYMWWLTKSIYRSFVRRMYRI